jgi:predicted dienelactone hydrolase
MTNMNTKPVSEFKIVRWIAIFGLITIVCGGWTIVRAQTLHPLSEEGPYSVGMRTMTFTDESRDAKTINVMLWYPALDEATNAAPDLSDAPYPVVAYSHGLGGSPAELRGPSAHLASYGFIVVAVSHQDNLKRFFIDRPLDVFLVIDQLTGMTGDDLAGLMDWERFGVMGWSMGATTTLQIAGMGMDLPAARSAWCGYTLLPDRCLSDAEYAEMQAQWEHFGATDDDGLWHIPNDLNPQAVIAMAGGIWGLFGERGLEQVAAPTLVMQGTADSGNADYEDEAIYLVSHLQSDDAIFISLINAGHSFPSVSRQVAPYLVAFFGYHLQGNEDYAEYLTEDYVNSVDGLAWGAYGG